MKEFFENFLALSVKKLKKVLMILPSISDHGQAFPAEYCRYMRCLAISNLYFLVLLVPGKETEESVDDSSYFTIKFLLLLYRDCSHCR